MEKSHNREKIRHKDMGDRKEFEMAVLPLMKYLAKNHNPHCSVIVTNLSAELVGGIMALETTKYIKD